MYLKKLEIYGFKSFGTKSTLDFENKKIAAIVGPNGSGKSNVADAIRWVLGEQSTNILRSKKGDDVIFVGSQKKSRSSYAEVCLFLSADEETEIEVANKKYSLRELEVSRKIYRSGENEYLINRKKVRLIDLQQLLATLGFGQSTYTVIGQGIVDRLLFFNAAERRVLFDEAAGVKQYKIKRGQAIKKLEVTEENLIRLSDIQRELEPQAQSLKRLVKKAQGRERVEEDLTESENEYYGANIFEYSAKIEALKSKISELKAKIDQKKTEIADIRDRGKDQEIKEVRMRQSVRKGELEQLLLKRDRLIRETSFLEGQAKEQESFFTNLKANRKNLLDEEKKISEAISSAIAKITEDEIKVNKLEQRIADLEIRHKKNEHLTVSSSPDEEYAKLTESRAEIEGQILRLREKEKWELTQKESFEKEKRSLALAVSNIGEELKEKKAKHDDLVSDKDRVEQEVSGLKRKLDKLQLELASTEKEVERLGSRIEPSRLASLKDDIKEIKKDHSQIKEILSSDKPVEGLKKFFPVFSVRFEKLIKKTEKITSAISPEEKKNFEDKISDIRRTVDQYQDEITDKVRYSHELNQKIVIINHQIQNLEKENIEKTERGRKLQLGYDGIDKKELAKLLLEKEKLDKKIACQEALIRKEQEKNKKADIESASQINACKVELARVEADLGHKKSDLENLKKQKDDISGLLQKSEDKDYDREYETKLKNMRVKLSETESEAKSLREEIEKASLGEQELENDVLRREREINRLEREASDIQSEMAEIELAKAKDETKLEGISAEVKGLARDIPEMNKIIDQERKDLLRARIENLRRKKDSIIGVDPETLSEYQALEARVTEMSKQIDDLEGAKDDLEKLIRELDKKIQGQFSITFNEISKKFQNYFSLLFEGGKADLQLAQDETGELGIEISANPPGKKIQSLAMLSGGERTLTSLALVFAILSVNPSPFCILDEVDAALDESNTIRFVKILKGLEKKTQFIVITHNRETMRIADMLYGLSMNEEHISTLFSIRLAEAYAQAK